MGALLTQIEKILQKFTLRVVVAIYCSESTVTIPAVHNLTAAARTVTAVSRVRVSAVDGGRFFSGDFCKQ